MKYQDVDRISRVRTILNSMQDDEKRDEFQLNSWMVEDNVDREEHTRIFGNNSPLITAVG